MGFSDDMADTDADAYAMLGDDAQYRAAGTTAWVPVSIFPQDREPGIDYSELDATPPKRRLLVSRAAVPNPTSDDRWIVALWGTGAWQMSNREPARANRDWLIEMQRATA